MKYETSLVYLEQLPKVVLETGFDWPTFWSFLVTAIIFVLGTVLTVHNFKKTIKSQEAVAAENLKTQREMIASQERVAKQNSLKSSRQAWINDLRDTTSRYIAEALNVQRLNVFWESARPTYRLHQVENPQLAHEMHSDWSSSHMQAMRELVSLRSKIELLINPEEVDSDQLMLAVNELFNVCDRAGGSANFASRPVVELCQHILKEEWEKAKAGR